MRYDKNGSAYLQLLPMPRFGGALFASSISPFSRAYVGTAYLAIATFVNWVAASRLPWCTSSRVSGSEVDPNWPAEISAF